MSNTNTEAITSNIPATGFAAIDVVHSKKHVLAEFNESARFTLSHFSLLQLLHGHPLTAQDRRMETLLAGEVLRKIAFYALEGEKDGEIKTVELHRKEVQLLRNWLEARMKHCEEERDSRATIHDGPGVKVVGHIDLENPSLGAQPVSDAVLKFNPDTYIAQKYLLLDIREWLLGDILD